MKTEVVTQAAAVVDVVTDSAHGAAPADRAQEAVRQSLETLMAHATIQSARHEQLYPGETPVRSKTGDLRELAASIRANGLLQNLVCHAQLCDGVPTGRWVIAAGKRRWCAIGVLIAGGWLPRDFQIPFLLVTEAEAVLVSLAENIHAPLHPADLFDGTLTLARQGRSADEIGWMFGLATKTVRQRLKLANVAPKLFALYRADKASYEQMAALAISDDHQAQQAAWDGLDEGARQPQRLRSLLTAHCLSAQTDSVARYVGIKAYEAAGGGVLRDLFSSEDEGLIEDGTLLEQLARAKLGKVALRLRKERWAWVDVAVRAGDAALADYGRIGMVTVAPSAEQAAALARCDEQAARLDAAMEALAKDGGGCGDEMARLVGERAAVDVERGKLACALRQPDPQQRALAGALVTLDENGNECVLRGLLKPQDKPDGKTGGRAGGRGHDGNAHHGGERGDIGTGTARQSKPRAAHSERLTRLLTAQRTLALHAELVRQPDTAVLVLVQRLIRAVFYGSHGDGVVQLQLTTPELPDEARSGPAWDYVESQRAALAQQLPESTDDAALLQWLRSVPRATVDAYLAFCVGATINGVQGREHAVPALEQLAQAVQLDMHAWWKPTAENYFAHVNKQCLLEVVATAATPATAAPLEALRKDAAAQAAARALDGSEWLPGVLRGQFVQAGAS